jgi:hypothetical protein
MTNPSSTAADAKTLVSRWGTVAFWCYLFVLVIAFGTSINKADPDLWQRFAVADYLEKMGHFPTGDTFGYLAYHEPRPDHEWGSAVILLAVYTVAGGVGIVLLKLVLLGVTVALTVRAGLGARAPAMLDAFFYSLVILALLASFLSTVRSEAWSHVFFALWVLWFQQERRGVKIPAWAYGFTMILWCNLHGGFILGLAWLGAVGAMEFLTGGDWKRRAGLLLLSLLATLVNPFGYRIWAGVYGVLSIPRAGFEEWAPVPWFHDVGTYSGYKILVLWMLAIVFSHIRLVGWRKCDRTAVVLLGLILIPSLQHVRQTSIFAIAAGGLLPPLFPTEVPLSKIREWKPWMHRFLVRGILVILPLIFALRILPANQGFDLTYPPDSCPVKAVDFLRQSGVTGRLLVGFNSGSYALWELRGKLLVSVDGRYEVAYPYETFVRVQRFYSGTDHWNDALAYPAPDAVLVNLPDPVYPKMLAEPGWFQAYHDATQAVFLPAARP